MSLTARLERLAQALSCPRAPAEDLAQEGHLAAHAAGPRAAARLRFTAARCAMLNALCHQRIAAGVVVYTATVPEAVSPSRPDRALYLRQLRDIVRARLRAHVRQAPELGPAVGVVLEEAHAAQVAAKERCAVSDIYRRAEMLRARLKQDAQLQQLAAEYAA